MRSWLGVVAIIAACGDGRIVPDATGELDDHRGLVTLTYLSDDVQLYNDVFFQKADSTLVVSTRTDGDGTANAYMAPGGFVTIAGANNHLYTFSDVQPGDELVLDTRLGAFGSGDEVIVRLSFAPWPNAVAYVLHSSCQFVSLTGSQHTIQQLSLFGCPRATTNMLLVAHDSFGNQAFQYRASVPLGFETTVDFGGPYHPSASSTVSVSSATSPQVFVDQHLVGFSSLSSGFGTINLAGGSGSTTVAVPIVPAATVATTLELWDGNKLDGEIFGTAFYVRQWEPARETTSIDLAGGTLREYQSWPAFDPAAQTVNWAEAPSGRLADGVLVELSYSTSEVFSPIRWSVIQRRTEDTMIRLPILPRERFNPRPDLDLGQVNVNNLVNFSVDGGYDRVRTNLLGRWNFENGVGPGAFPIPADGPSGRASYRSLF